MCRPNNEEEVYVVPHLRPIRRDFWEIVLLEQYYLLLPVRSGQKPERSERGSDQGGNENMYVLLLPKINKDSYAPRFGSATPE